MEMDSFDPFSADNDIQRQHSSSVQVKSNNAKEVMKVNENDVANDLNYFNKSPQLDMDCVSLQRTRLATSLVLTKKEGYLDKNSPSIFAGW